MTPKLVIATPVDGADVWTARVTVGYSESLRALARELPVECIEAQISIGADVVRSRNRIAAVALREFPRMTHVLHWDEDQWPQDRGCVQRMIDLGVDLVGAPYTRKMAPATWVHRTWDPCPPEREDGALDVRCVGFGFTLTSRRCLERMTAAARRYTDYPRKEKVSDIFGHLYEQPHDSTDPEDEAKLSEDFSFCKRWRDMGEKVYLYTRSGTIWHSGSKAWSAGDRQR